MTKKTLVVYLYTKFDKIDSLIDFKLNYLKFHSGYSHELLICFKLLNENDLKMIKKHLDGIDYISFIDDETKNDYDFGSYKRVALRYRERDIFFINSHSYPICEKWLQKLMKYKDENTLIGTSASNESLINSTSLKKPYKIFSYLFKKLRLKKAFNKFPNPHIRTSSFLIKGQILLDYMINKEINNKEDTWRIESGKDSLTNYFEINKFDFFVVNSDGHKFQKNQWMFSETFNYLDQTKSIISDKHTRKYLSLNKEDKYQNQIKTWGNN